MVKYSKQDIIRMVKDDDVEFIRLQFTDLFGNLKNVAITISQLEKALNNECMFDGSSIEGFARIEQSDMYLYPDPDTYVTFPWRPQQGKVARLICDLYTTDHKPFCGDPRHVLKKVLKEAEDMGYSFDIGPELEFFLFNLDENGHPTTITQEKAGYFDLGPLDYGENARRDMVLTLEEMGVTVDASHHEVAFGQHEIDMNYDTALTAADNIMTFKLVARTIARRHGLHATFMPKPRYGVNGSGMHINISMRKNDKNIFDNPDSESGLSKEAYHFIAGIMKHIDGITAVTNPLVNSYKRLVPNYEAPVYVAWSVANRSPLIRVPSERGNSTRIELRFPDPSANPYLALAVCLAAGLDGIKNKLMPPDSMDMNIFELSAEQKEKLGIRKLPSNLDEAIRELEKNEFILNVLGEHISSNYINSKKKEWEDYRSRVTQWEIDQYLNRY